MAHFEKPRINAHEVKEVPADQAFLDKAVDDLSTVVNTLAASLPSKLSASGYGKIRAITKLDDATVKEQDRKTLIAAAAPSEAAALLPQARIELAKVVDYTQASNLGLDPKRINSLLVRMLEDQLKAAVINKMTETHQELVKLRTDYRSTLTTEGNKITRDVADKVALDVSKDSNKELHAMLRTGKVNLPRSERDKLIVTASQQKTDSELAAAVQELVKRVPLSQAVALGLDPTDEKTTIEKALKSTLQAAIKNKLTEGYDKLCDESRARAETRATGWGWAKLLAPAALLVATGATVAIIGGTSLVFWGPVGGFAMIGAYGVCRLFQNRTVDNHLN